MAGISDRDRSVFEEAYITPLDNFTDTEQINIGTLAVALKVILEAAKKRQQESLPK